MENDMPYGKRLTQEEFSHELSKILDIAQQYSPEGYEIEEFNLLIDFKLGADFPEEKRRALIISKKNIQKYHAQLVKRFQDEELSNEEFAMEVQKKIPNMMVKEFAKTLSPDELNILFDIVEGQVPVIPVDHTKLRRSLV